VHSNDFSIFKIFLSLHNEKRGILSADFLFAYLPLDFYEKTSGVAIFAVLC